MCIQETYTHDAAGHTQKVNEKSTTRPEAGKRPFSPSPTPPPPFRLFRPVVLAARFSIYLSIYLLAKRHRGSQIGCHVLGVGLSSKPYSANQREL